MTRSVGRTAGIFVLLLTAAFFLRGIFFAVALPSGDPLDETFHFAYACFRAEAGRLPGDAEPSIPAEFDRATIRLPASDAGAAISWRDYARLPPERRRQLRQEAFEYRSEERRVFVRANYETQQPPAFYESAAALLRLYPRSPFSTRLLAVRLLSIVFAAAAVPLVYAFVRRLLSRPSALAATAAYVAFPGVGVFAGRFTNDALALPVAAALLSLFVDAGRGRLTRARAAWLSALLAIGCWTKLYFLLFLPIAPLAALVTTRGRRSGAWRKALLASMVALLLFLPWMIHQNTQTGDWLGLLPSKQATSLHVGMLERLRTLPDLLVPRFAIVFGRTFLWPGTRSAMGAPAALAVLLSLVLLALVLFPNLSGAPASRRRREAWGAGGLALASFLAGQIAYASTYAAVGRARGHAPSAGPDGWYVLVLLPVVLCAGAAFGRGIGARLFRLSAGLFVAADLWMIFGVLAGVYGGRTEFNGSNAPPTAYATYLLRPGEVLRGYERVGLAGLPAWVLALVVGLWLVLLAAGILGPKRLGLSQDRRELGLMAIER